MATYKTIHTAYGLQRMAAAEASGTPINLLSMAVGDGNGNAVFPVESQTGLAREVYRHAVNRVFQDPAMPSKFTAELVIPATVSGFTLREVGIFDAYGGLFAVANLPATYKPYVSEGAYSDTVIRMEFVVSNASVVNLVVDPNVAVATHTWVANNVTRAYLIPGGNTGQILTKRTNADGDTEWRDAGSVNVLVSGIEEKQTLAANQVDVNLSLTTTAGMSVFIDGVRIAKEAGVDGWLPHSTVLTRVVLGKSYPTGTKIICSQNEPNSKLVDPLARSQNLADVLDKTAARANLDVFSRAEATQLAPVSEIAYFARSTAPAGWLKANGGAISRTAYAELYALIGTSFGAGDGFNTFNLPDLRGEFVRGLDDSRGVDPGRVLGSPQAQQLLLHSHDGSSDTRGSHTHEGQTSTDGSHDHASGLYTNLLRKPYPGSITGTDTTGSGHEQAVGDNDSGPMAISGAHSHALVIQSAGAHNHAITVSATGGAENRPRNVALLACIKY